MFATGVPFSCFKFGSSAMVTMIPLLRGVKNPSLSLMIFPAVHSISFVEICYSLVRGCCTMHPVAPKIWISLSQFHLTQGSPPWHLFSWSLFWLWLWSLSLRFVPWMSHPTSLSHLDISPLCLFATPPPTVEDVDKKSPTRDSSYFNSFDCLRNLFLSYIMSRLKFNWGKFCWRILYCIGI